MEKKEPEGFPSFFFFGKKEEWNVGTHQKKNKVFFFLLSFWLFFLLLLFANETITHESVQIGRTRRKEDDGKEKERK